MIELYPFQKKARTLTIEEWAKGIKRTLLVMATGTGKTITFADITRHLVTEERARVLILAHRDELIRQAQDKIFKFTGIRAAIEKAEETALDSLFRVTIGSVQTMCGDKRLAQFARDYYTHIIVDEAHHVLGSSYLKVLNHFDQAKLLGVTATPDRGDKRDLGKVFESIAFEYPLMQAVKEGYLCDIKSQTMPLSIDVSGVGMGADGDFDKGQLGTALDPYLPQIASELWRTCKNRKLLVFLPLRDTARRMAVELAKAGFTAFYVGGDDRSQLPEWDASGAGSACCNAMLLCLDMETEILTDDGFVSYGEMTKNHKVANWNMDGSVFFERPLEICHRKLYENEHMVSVDSRTINFRVTNTHRMIVKKHGCGWKKTAAGELTQHDKMPGFGIAPASYKAVAQDEYKITKRMLASTSYLIRKKTGCNTEDSYAEALRRKQRISGLKYTQPKDLSLDQCRLIGLWIADGSRSVLQSGGVEYILCQSPVYPRIIKWVDDLLLRLPYSVKRKERVSRKNPAVLWSLCRGSGHGCQERTGLYNIEPYLQKNGSKLFWGLNEAQFDALVEGYWYGDGFHGQAENGMPKSIMVSDTKKGWIDTLCAIGTVRGWRCHMMPRKMKNPKHKDQWYLRMIKGMNIHLSSKTPIIHEPYKEEHVWCVKTTSKNIITRRHGKVTIMGNTEGYDNPAIDAVCVLRLTRVRSLYVQMLGRGTRLSPGKDFLYVPDFLWHTDTHNLCRPASLVAPSQEIANLMMAAQDAAAEKDNEPEQGRLFGLTAEEISAAQREVIEQREKALAKQLEEMRKKKAKLVDPIQFAASIADEDMLDYVPNFPHEAAPATDAQLKALEKAGIFPEEGLCLGKASMILDKLALRRANGMASPKQIRCLERYGVRHAGECSFDDAQKAINRLAANAWRKPWNNWTDAEGRLIK